MASFAVITAVVASLIVNSNNENQHKGVCESIYEQLYPIYENSAKISNFNQNDIYKNIYLMQTHLNLTLSKTCEKPSIKELPWLAKTPYNYQVSPFYEFTLIWESFAVLYRGLTILSVDMIIMTMMIYIKFQFETINSDLVRECLISF